MSIKHERRSENDNVQQNSTALMEDSVITMENDTILMAGPTTNDTTATIVKIKKVTAK